MVNSPRNSESDPPNPSQLSNGTNTEGKSEEMIHFSQMEALRIEINVLQCSVELLKRKLLDANSTEKDRIILEKDQKIAELEEKIANMELSKSANIVTSQTQTEPTPAVPSAPAQPAFKPHLPPVPASNPAPLPTPPASDLEDDDCPPLGQGPKPPIIGQWVKKLNLGPTPQKSFRTIALQVYIDDPDVYWYAGGRHVGSQTVGFQEYDLDPLKCYCSEFRASTKPVIIVYDYEECSGFNYPAFDE